jgi:hypothetical protein
VTDRDQRNGFMMLHLGAWVPDAVEAARDPLGLSNFTHKLLQILWVGASDRFDV